MNSLLTTSRLIIEEPSLNDLDNLYNLQSNPQVMKYIGEGIRDRMEVIKGLKKAIDHFKKHNFSLGSVYLKHSHKFIGRAGLIYFNYNDKQPKIEVAYALLPDYWGKGYATELTKALSIWAFQNLSINKLIAVVHPENIASEHVLIKSGMSSKGTLKYWDIEVLNFEIIKPPAPC
ncbi:MAG: GNAT family N-acetyltransferase [Tatlockia sp.]|nr:GNAT family N-acetyltransferase [Tatlockia sp.]